MNRFSTPLKVVPIVLWLLAVAALVMTARSEPHSAEVIGYAFAFVFFVLASMFLSIFVNERYSKEHLHESTVRDRWVERRQGYFGYHTPLGKLIDGGDVHLMIKLRSGFAPYKLHADEMSEQIAIGDHVLVSRRWHTMERRWHAVIISREPAYPPHH